MFFAQRKSETRSTYKVATLLLSLTIHFLVFLLVKPQSLASLTNAEISFDTGKLIINTILNDSPKNVTAPIIQKKVIKERVQKTDKAPALTKKEIVAPIEQAVSNSTPQTQTFDQSILTNVTPHYPRIALKRGWQGFVKVRLTVAPNGRVSSVNVLEKNAHDSLIESALKAANQWIFKVSPNGRPYLVDKRIVFKIN